MRRALGSSRARLVRLMLTESALLAGLGGVLGAGVTVWMVEAILAAVPAGMPRIQEISVDGRVLLFTAATVVVTAVAFGIIPALQSSRSGAPDALKEGTRGGSAARGLLRSAVVVVEFALALVLLVGAGLLIESFWRLSHVDLGFNPQHVLTARLWLPQPNVPSTGRYQKHDARVALYTEILRRAAELPGVERAAAVGTLPLDGSRNLAAFTVEGHETEAGSEAAATNINVASSGYFEVMGLRVRRGRSFTDHDSSTSEPVAVISESLAQVGWTGQDPIGRRLHLGGPDAKNPWMRVIGIVNDVRTERLEDAPVPMVYRPLLQVSGLALALVLKTSADPRALTPALARAVRAVDPDQPTYGVRTMDAQVAYAAAARRFATQLLGVFAAIALLLAAVGIYGVMAFVVGQRTREMGIRIALGARPAAVVRLVLGQALTLAAIGVLIGAGGAAALSRLLSGLLFEARPIDPVLYGTIAATLTATAGLAAWRPARRAARVDPITALRAD